MFNKLCLSLIFFALSAPSFANYEVSCSNWRGDIVLARFELTGETRRNGPWYYETVSAEIKFDVRGRKGRIQKTTEVIHEKDEWYVEAFNTSQTDFEFVHFVKSGRKVSAKYRDVRGVELKLPCDLH